MVAEDLAADEEGNLVGPRPPRTELTEDGYLVINGDMYLHCPSTARETARQCGEAGYVGAEQYAGQTSPTVGSDPTGTATMLPETGGGALWLGGLDALAMVGGFLLCRRIR